MILEFLKSIDLESVINACILLTAVFTLFQQSKFNKQTMDYAYQPSFELKKFCDHDDCTWSPMFCGDQHTDYKNKCQKDHWFNLENVSQGVASNVEVFFLHEKEVEKFDYKKLDTSIVKKKNALVKNSALQYALDQNVINYEFYDKSEKGTFYVVVSYTTIAKSKRFIQIFELCYIPKFENTKISSWTDMIIFYGYNMTYFKEFSWVENWLMPLECVYKEAINEMIKERD